LSQDILQNLVILLDKYHKLTLDEFKKQLIQLILQNGFSTNVANKFVEIVLNFINGNFDL
jgi:transposase